MSWATCTHRPVTGRDALQSGLGQSRGRCSGWKGGREVMGCAGAEMPWFPQDTPFPPPITPGCDCSLSSVHLLYRFWVAAGSLPHALRLAF